VGPHHVPFLKLMLSCGRKEDASGLPLRAGLTQRVANPLREQLLASDEGALLAALVKDFLASVRLGFTLKVYEPEVRLAADDDLSREQLAGILVRPCAGL